MTEVDQVIGHGAVYRDGDSFVGEARYSLRVVDMTVGVERTKDRVTFASHRTNVTGHVTGLDVHPLLAEHARLTLHLQDGRRLDFQFIDPDGGIVVQRSFYPPPAPPRT